MWAILFLWLSRLLLTYHLSRFKSTIFFKVKNLQETFLLFSWINLQLDKIFWCIFINKHIGTFAILSFLPIVLIIICVGSSKTFSFNIRRVESADHTIIILMPFSFFIFNITYIMSHLRVSYMTDDSCQLVLIVRVLFDKVRIILLLALIIIKSIRVNVEWSRKLMLIC